MKTNIIYNMNCIDGMKILPDNCIDAVVTDPPYELGFMGKLWDNTGIAYNVEMWKEVLRVLKPGGHLLSFGGTRTYHRMACAIEDAGFEIRDQLQWLYGSGFPKSMDISKAIDKKAGKGEPITDIAKQWDGFGTSLKPANEPICLARKPLAGKTIVDNVLKYGTGGLNIDACRIGEDLICAYGGCAHASNRIYGNGIGSPEFAKGSNPHQGRFPANVIFDEDAAALLDKQTGTLKSGTNCTRTKTGTFLEHGGLGKKGDVQITYADSGGASRFFYCAKASRSERDLGLGNMPIYTPGEITGGRKEGSAGLNNPRAGAGRTSGGHNNHPTVKPIKLMEYLTTLVTPPRGIILDPFMGSGTTAIACINRGFWYLGFEMNKEYCSIAEARIQKAIKDKNTEQKLF